MLDSHFEQLIEAVNARVANAEALEDYASRMIDASFYFENASDLPIRKIANGFSADERVNMTYLRHEKEFMKHWDRLLRS